MAKLFSGIIAIVVVTIFALYVITATAQKDVDHQALVTCVKTSIDQDCSAVLTAILLETNPLYRLESVYECLTASNDVRACSTLDGVENDDQTKSQINCALSPHLLDKCKDLIPKPQVNVSTP